MLNRYFFIKIKDYIRYNESPFFNKKNGQVHSMGSPRQSSGQAGQAGFSLPELIVGIYVFSIVMVMGSGAIMAVLRSQRIVLKEQELLDNTRGSLEVMSKALRLSYDYQVPAPGNTGITSILVNHPAKTGLADCPTTSPCPVKYYRSTVGNIGVIYEQNCPSGCVGVNGGLPGAAIPLTSDQVNIRKLEFVVTGYGTVDDNQARVTIYMEFSPGTFIAGNRIIPIQTTLTQRLFDVP